MMVKSLFTTLLLILSLCAGLHSQSTTINGTAPAYKGKEIMVLSYLDHFTKTLNLEDICVVDSSGNFSLSVPSSDIKLVNLRCDYTNAHLYINPGSSYNVIFPALPAGVSKSINNTARVDLILNDLPEDDINSLVIEFNAHYEGFFQRNVKLLAGMAAPNSINSDKPSTGSKKSVRQKYLYKLQKFSTAMDSLYPGSSEDFFQQYRKSIEAEMHLNVNSSPRYVYDNYIKNDQFNINHPEQTMLLATFYDNYLKRFEDKYGPESFNNGTKGNIELFSTLSELGKDDFLENPLHQQIVLAFELHNAWYDDSLDKTILIQLLEEMKASGSDETKFLAKNILEKVTKNTPGQDAYNYSLMDESNQIHQLEKHEGKYVVLEFWATWCKSCLTEMQLSSVLHEKYKERFQFVSISVDEKGKDVWSFLEDNSDLNQEVLHAGQDKLIMDEFGIRSLPAYIIIDKDGKILDPKAPFPSHVLEASLFKINTEEEKLKKDNFDPVNRE